ncbi:MAG: class III poly(R)-hydroxyalkanoic acid synthase subunit PhaC, partial [Magnetococcales bacterium]|nr:class III poly(R)-hydroxyalkanoic acid synthase subunit PhaC [Magnetococcales bacterium]
MFPLSFQAENVLQEVTEFQQKLANGMKTLSELGPIDVGVSAKEPVYREDKMVLYHFVPQVE